MKKSILILSSVLLISATVSMVGCKKDDTTAPVVTLNGAESQTISLQGSYVELGATANDDKDGDITVTITGSVDKNNTGNYTLTYSATDAAGNEGTATRTVSVVNDAEYLVGAYNCNNPLFAPADNWVQNVTTSTTVNNKIYFSKFANLSNNTTVTATVLGSVDINTTTASGVGSGGCTERFDPNGSGTAPTLVGGKYTFKVRYFQTTTGGAGCTTTGAVPYEDTFVHQ